MAHARSGFKRMGAAFDRIHDKAILAQPLLEIGGRLGFILDDEQLHGAATSLLSSTVKGRLMAGVGNRHCRCARATPVAAITGIARLYACAPVDSSEWAQKCTPAAGDREGPLGRGVADQATRKHIAEPVSTRQMAKGRAGDRNPQKIAFARGYWAESRTVRRRADAACPDGNSPARNRARAKDPGTRRRRA